MGKAEPGADRMPPHAVPEAAPGGRGVVRSLPLAGILLLFWIVLSGKLDAFHLGCGVVSVVFVSWVAQRLLSLPPTIGVSPTRVFDVRSALRLLVYVPWLAWQVAVANAQIAYVVLHPRLPIRPHLVRFRYPLPHNLARLTLANSITLTPGTVTLDVDGDEFLIHALTDGAARGLGEDGQGDMQRRVAHVFETRARDGVRS